MSPDSQIAPTLSPQKKKRYEWIDNARIVAAFLIMIRHLPCESAAQGGGGVDFVQTVCSCCVYNGRVPFFLILAGYFLSRNVTWRKAWDRFIWLLVPFVIWNAIYAYIFLHHSFSFQMACVDLLGINNIIHGSAISLFGSSVSSYPVIGPSWFLRDIMFLSLLTPLIVRFDKWIPIILVVMTALMLFQMPPMSAALFAPTTVYFYLLGVFLVRFRLDDAYRILNRSFLPYFVSGTAVAFIGALVMFISGVREFRGLNLIYFFSSTFGMVFGALLIAYYGILIEKLLPRFSKLIAPLGPACFLVFMLHYPLFHILQINCPSLFEGWHALLVPVPLFIAICTFFLLMKRFTPFLMPYLGHMKMTKPAAKRASH